MFLLAATFIADVSVQVKIGLGLYRGEQGEVGRWERWATRHISKTRRAVLAMN